MTSLNPFCEHCSQGYVLSGEPKGTMQPNGAYFHPAPVSSDTNVNPTDGKKRAVVLITDAFGLKVKNSKILADRFSEALGCDVWAPDIFGGNEPFKPEDLKGLMGDTPGQTKISFGFILKAIIAAFKYLPTIIRSRPSALDARVHPFLTQLREEHKYDKIGAVGYCMGGATVARAAGQNKLIDSGVVCHPARTTIAQIEAINVPTAWVMAEEDPTFPPKQQEEAEVIFASRKDKPNYVDYEFKQYKGVVHGFAARPNLGIPQVKEGFEGAFTQTVAWFQKTL